MLRFLSRRPVLAAFLFYLAAAVVLTWPLTPRLGRAIPLGDNDIWQNYWNAWWWKECLEDGRSPFHTDLLFHPTGASLGWHTHSPANVIAALPAAWAAEALGGDGPAAVLGAATLAGFVLAGLGAFLLAREAVGPGPAVLAGLVFAYFPQHVEQSLEHLNLASYWAMPFALLFLVRAARGGGARAWIPAGLFLGLNALLSWHNGGLLAFTAAAVAVSGLRRSERRGRGLAGILLSGAVCLLLVLPFLWPMLVEAAQGGGGRKVSVHKPVDPLFLLIPHSGHPLWGPWVTDLYARFRRYPSAGFVAYLGIATLALSAAAASWRGRALGPPGEGGRSGFRFWALLALLHLVLALGRSLQTGGVDFPQVPLPFALLEHVPVLNTVRVANRFLVPAMLAFSMLAAMGGAALASHLRRPALSRLALAGMAALIAFDDLWLPYPMQELPRPAWLEKLAELPPGLAVLPVPTGAGPRAAEDMFHQTRHRRPLASGYVSLTPPEIRKTLAEHPALEQVFLAHPPPSPRESLADAVRALGVGIVVVHLDRERERIEEERDLARRLHPRDLYGHRLYNPEKGMPAADLARARRSLREAFGPPVHADRDVEIYLAPRG